MNTMIYAIFRDTDDDCMRLLVGWFVEPHKVRWTLMHFISVVLSHTYTSSHVIAFIIS